MKLFPMVCCDGLQGRAWIETWGKMGQFFQGFAVTTKIAKNYG